MVLKAGPARQSGSRPGYGILLAGLLVFGSWGGRLGWSQSGANGEAASAVDATGADADPAAEAPSDSLAQWEGLPVRGILILGVSLHGPVPMPRHMNREDLKRSLRLLFATGLFETIEVTGERIGDGV